ncbi:MAG: hypothetical protein H6836_04780, partial [Planctomycetes bacterium]|nr:hypothetical protein [Planctomycetota bacterium]
MDVLQFSLFFAALLIGYVLVHLRLAKFETYLREVVVLRQLNERLQGVAEAMDRVKVNRLEEALQVLHQDMLELLDTGRKVEAGVGAARAEQGRSGAAHPALSVGERMRASIEERLFQLGYQKLRILTDLREVRLDEEAEVRVECERRMMPCKGIVTARNSAILDVDVRTVVGMF